MTPTGRTKDAGWEIGVSRTVRRPLSEVWALLTSPAGVAVWLGDVDLPTEPGAGYETVDGTTGEIRSYRTDDRIRLTWQPPDWSHESTVQIALSPSPTGTRIVFHQERLADATEREQQRAHWRRVADRLLAPRAGRTTDDV